MAQYQHRKSGQHGQGRQNGQTDPNGQSIYFQGCQDGQNDEPPTPPLDPVQDSLLQTASSWCEVSQAAIEANVRLLRQRIGSAVRLGVVVKADAFGHGLIPCAIAFLQAGADWLIVNFAYEAIALRQAGITAPIYICGNVSAALAPQVVATQARLVLYDAEVASALAQAAQGTDTVVPVHLKIETGTHRQGLPLAEALDLARFIQTLDGVELEGITTHYADIEDTTNHRFARQQLTTLQAAQAAFRQAGFEVPMVHSANSAATLLWPEAHGSLVRVGIAAYGLWPSTETYVTLLQTAGDRPTGSAGQRPDLTIPQLEPVLSWRARVAQVKAVPVGGYVGYGRTYRATHPMKIAVLPLGYHEGYDRRLSNLGYVIIHGLRAPICGRICMNMMMVDVTHIPEVRVGSVATLLGTDGEEQVNAEQLAAWMGTINYEVVSRIHPSQPRVVIPANISVQVSTSQRPAAALTTTPPLDVPGRAPVS
ncbi:MAG: alanine racemase [Synechococcales bacterium]|nr:alanine racemase [Synechococcales bacterium]